MNTLTTEQQLSLRTDINLSVTANAGSGKTFILVERYKRIIDTHFSIISDYRFDPSQIIAITFTRKAASEMQKKIVNAFDKAISEQVMAPIPNRALIDKLKKIREGLSYSNISTIHSFCSSLLRQFPVEADVPVVFAELDEAKKIKLLEQAFNSTLDDWLYSDEQRKAEAKLLLLNFPKTDLQNIISIIINKIEIFDDLEFFYKKTSETIKAEIINAINNNYQLELFFESIKQLIQITLEDDFLEPKNSKSKKYINKCNAINEFKLNNDLNPIDNLNILNYIDFTNEIRNFKVLIKAVYTDKYTLRTDVADITKRPEDINTLNRISEQLGIYPKLIQFLDSIENFDDSLNLSEIIWKFTNNVLEYLDEEKYYIGGLDFNDLQLKVKKLLENEEVLKKIQSQIKFIMIDEFQDTNKLQYDIIKLLIPELSNHDSFSNINLFVVGDAKQSIYGFRNADVRVFNNVIDNIYQLNLHLDSANKIKKETEITNPERPLEEHEFLGKNYLTSTFRLRPVLASFVNVVCSKLMNKDFSQFDVDYNKLVCSKDTDKITFNDDGSINAENNLGQVVFLLSKQSNLKSDSSESVSENNTDNDDDNNLLEENLLSFYIEKLIQEENYEYGQIAILSRSRGKFNKLKRVLLERNIPFILHAGKGFYETEEISDFISFLSFIYNNNDDAALTGILRSPFFNHADSEIYHLKMTSPNSSLRANLNKIDNELHSVFYRTKLVLNQILKVSYSMPISKIILTIMQKTGWNGMIADNPGKNQMIANVNKFITFARNYESTGFRNIYDFVDEMKYISEHSAMESEAYIETGENAVNIMTIHAAKGLQFPVIILYNTNAEPGNNSQYNISSEFGPGFKLNIPTDSAYEKKLETPFSLINKIIKAKEGEAEAKRILYVAMTRAEDILAISVNSNEKKNHEMWKPKGQYKMIIDALGLDTNSIFNKENIIIEDNLPIRLKDTNNMQYYIKEYPIKYNINLLQIEDFSDQYSSINPINSESPLILLDRISSKQESEAFSPSKIGTFNYSKKEFIDKYILGLPDEKSYGRLNTIENTNQITATDIGSSIHYVLEHLSDWCSKDFIIDHEKLKSLISYSLNYKFFDDNDTNHLRLLNECINVTQTRLIRYYYEQIKNGKAEYRLTIPIGEHIISGIIDLIITNDDGQYEIWDWKSNLINSIEDSNHLLKNYELQMKIYSLFVSKLYPAQQTVKARLLFTKLAGKDVEDEKWTYVFEWNRDELNTIPDNLTEQIKNIRDELYVWL